MPTQNTNNILNTNIDVYQPYSLVRSGIFHYLEVINDEKDLFTSSSKLESTPNIVYYTEGADTKIMLDYTNASDKDKKYLDILTSNLNDFSGLSLSNAVYLNEKEGIVNKSLATNFLFREFKNNILFGKTTSSVAAGDINKVFLSDYFVDIPNLSTNSVWDDKTSQTVSLITNTNPKTEINFDKFSINVGDLVEIINPASSNTQNRFEVTEYSTINNKQVITLKTPAIAENLLGSSTVLNFYAKTKSENLKSLELNNTIIGCCQDLKTKQLYENATEQECYIRTNGAYVHNKNTNCSAYTNDIPLPTININSSVIQLKKAEFVLYDKTDLIEVAVSIQNSKFLLDGNDYTSFGLQKGKIYKFLQNDESNLGYPLRICTSNPPSIDQVAYYQYDMYGIVYPEGVGSEIYLKVTDNTNPILYLGTEKDTTISSPVLVVL
jgi:hypothetical protein